jgi:glycerol-3-phosphate dehydrogenase
VRLVKGSHIVVHKIFDHEHSYIFQNADDRVIFAIPYERDFTLIGTTDFDYSGDPKDVAISSKELNYLCEVASEYFKKPVKREQVAWAYSGVRPLFDDGTDAAQEATRDYVLERPEDDDLPPLLNVYGGKLTTYRRLAEEALDKVGEAIGAKGAPWTTSSTLPGGEFATHDVEGQMRQLSADFPFLTRRQVRRYLHLYGTCTRHLLGDAQSNADLGENFGADLTSREVDYLIDEEWVTSCNDILWRRTKLGLHMSDRDLRALQSYLDKRLGGMST